MRVLVTGAGGFVGRHLVKNLIDFGHEPLSFDLKPLKSSPPETSFQGDLRNADELNKMVASLNPEGCIHLGGIAFVPMGWTDPHLVFSVNVLGTINLLEAFRLNAPQARMLVVTSSEVYGMCPKDHLLHEDSPLDPSGLYGVSKVAADLMALLYARRYSMHIMTARPLNHIGPGQSPAFVSSAFADQILDIVLDRKNPPVIKVGNLETERDFTDVRDVVRAYRLLLEKGKAGEAYNIASGKKVKIRFLLDELCRLARVDPVIEIDPQRYRLSDSSPAVDSGKILREAGWKPEIPISQTLEDILTFLKKKRCAGI
jgi:GDP-4-dehydro-6-deoxy-D-mannose reductase